MAGSYTTGTVSGSIVNHGIPCSGNVIFTPDDPDVVSTLNLTNGGVPTATLDASGNFSIVLPATDDPNLGGGAWSYEITFQLAGAVLNGVMATTKVPANTSITMTGMPASVGFLPGVKYVPGPAPAVAWDGDRLSVTGSNGTFESPDLTGKEGPNGRGNVAYDTDGVPYVDAAAVLPIVGTGSPVGVVTPDQAGQHYTDTAGTNGAWEWIATGTTTSSWLVIAGRTAWKDLSAKLTTPTASSGAKLQVRRNVNTVDLKLDLTWTSSGSNTISSFFASGYRCTTTALYVPTYNWLDTAIAAYIGINSNGAFSVVDAVSGKRTLIEFSWPTDDSWPTT